MKTEFPIPVEFERASHADCSHLLRLSKARKIATLLAPFKSLAGVRLLDVGTGSGYIAASLAESVGPAGSVTSVDRVDERKTQAGFEFVQVDDCRLPFDDGSFDIAISNHVIEHVGWEDDQRTHLNELNRVLTRNGVLYLAAPNQWSIVEPHFRLPFLSWLPVGMRSRYVRSLRKGAHYDCYPRSRKRYRLLLSECGFAATDVTAEAVKAMINIEQPTLAGHIAAACPPSWIRGCPILPTIIFVAQPMGDTSDPNGMNSQCPAESDSAVSYTPTATVADKGGSHATEPD